MWLTPGYTSFFVRALRTKLLVVRRRAAASSPLFNMVRVQFYYFYLTPAPRNLYSTISQTLNSFGFFWACLCRVGPIYSVRVLSTQKCRLIFMSPDRDRLSSPLIALLESSLYLKCCHKKKSLITLR